MLSSTYQLNAYKALSAAGGLITPVSAIKATEAATVATSLGETLAGTLISTVTYPSSVTDFTGQIASWSQALENAAEDATTYAALMTEYADPSMLIQLTSGWDVYCRANALDASELTISAAIGDATEPDALLTALNTVITDTLVAAMADINTTLSATTGSTATSTGTTTAPTLTDAQVSALQAAVLGASDSLAAVTTALSTLDSRHSAAQNSATQAEDAFSKAISVALINSSISSAAVGSAVSAITPASVLTILERGSS